MTVTQKSSLMKTAFAFEDKALTLKVTDAGKTTEHVLPYEEIEFTNPSLLTRSGLAPGNGYTIFFGFVFYMVFVAVLVLAVTQKTGLKNDGLIILCLAPSYFFLVYLLRGKLYLNEKFQIFVAPKQNVVVLDDAQGKELAQELMRRCKARLRFLYGTLDVLGNPSGELEKFEQLKKFQVIDTVEFDAVFEKLKARIREKNLEIDPEAFPEDEQEKFEWMHGKKIISDTELADVLARLDPALSMAGLSGLTGTGRPH